MDSNSSPTTPIYSDFLEQVKLAQAALKTLLATSGQKDSDRDDDVVRLVFNKAMKATVSLHFLAFSYPIHCLFIISL